MACYREFVARLPDDGVLIVNGDCEAARDVSLSARARKVTFGTTLASDWSLRESPGRHEVEGVESTSAAGEQVRVNLVQRGTAAAVEWPVTWPLTLSGQHNRLNALAGVALGHELGIPVETLIAGLTGFSGIGRRFDVIGEWRGRIVVDDYAHHPTAIAATLRAAAERFPGQRIGVVFQPHQISRTTALRQEFAASLARADSVLLAPIFAAREAGVDQRSASDRVLQELAAEIASQGTYSRCCTHLDQIIPTLETDDPPMDVLVIMGAGDIERVRHELSGRVQ